MATVAGRRLFVNSLRIRLQVISSMNYGGGKDSGSSGAIRESGGAFGKKEKAEEDRFFRQLQKDQLKNLKSELHSEIKHHEEQIKHHEEALKRHKKRLTEVKED